ncbi:MAG: cell division/cell wall cluster transcriptional repressor MraZ [Rickettsiales bacterium]|nr:cell division/cell wall cluster transcriptional repressor MraZ [Rickettsiales bacterium]
MLFLSTFHNRIDKKGRISIPAPFRAVLAVQDFAGIVAYGSPVNPCVEACGMQRIHKLNQRIERFDPYSEERDAFATTIFGESVQLAFDTEGRVMLPDALLKAAKLTEQATIVGKGEIFEIWEPKSFEQHVKRARELVREKRFQLKGDAQ